jgi:hypothetical protein
MKNVEYFLDISDFASDKQVLSAIKKILELNKNERFRESLNFDDNEYHISQPNLKIILRECKD